MSDYYQIQVQSNPDRYVRLYTGVGHLLDENLKFICVLKPWEILQAEDQDFYGIIIDASTASSPPGADTSGLRRKWWRWWRRE